MRPAKEPDMQNFMTPTMADSFAADAERRWLFGHPYRVERPRRTRAARRTARSGRRTRALARLRAA
jgi:hypothetical protein